MRCGSSGGRWGMEGQEKGGVIREDSNGIERGVRLTRVAECM